MEKQKVAGTYTLPYIIKAEWTSYLVFLIMFGPFILICLVVTLIEPSNWPMLFIALFFGSFLFWVYSFRITLEDDRISYKTLFSRPREMMYSNIRKMKVETGGPFSWRDAKGFIRLNIYDDSKQPIVINMKPFSRRDLAIVVDVMASKASSVEMDEHVRQIREQNLEPIISEGIRKYLVIVLRFLVAFSALAILYALIR